MEIDDKSQLPRTITDGIYGAANYLASVKGCFTIICLLVILLPAFLLGPYLPIIDIIQYVGLHNYPPKLSFGPEHIYVFQFTFILPHILLRLLHDMQISAAWQICLLYCLLMLVAFFVLSKIYTIFFKNGKMYYFATAASLFAVWDGLFLWGGPLPFSLAAALFSIAFYYYIREGAYSEDNSIKITAILFLACTSHPFAIPFVLILLGVRFLVQSNNTQRVKALLCMVPIFCFAALIMIDSPESDVKAELLKLVSFHINNLIKNVKMLYLSPKVITEFIYSERMPKTLQIFFWVRSSIILLGFALSAICMFLKSTSRPHRYLYVYVFVTLLLYLTSVDVTDVIVEWPARILSFSGIFLFASGFIVIHQLISKTRLTRPITMAASAWGNAPLIILIVCMSAIHTYLPFNIFYPKSKIFQFNYLQVRSQLIEEASNCFITFRYANLNPYYLHSMEKLLFSDKKIIASGILLENDWHKLQRHNTRVINANNKKEVIYLIYCGKDRLLHVRKLRDGNARELDKKPH